MPSPFEAEFARAWDTPGHTRYQLPNIDINQVLAARYTTSKPYIPYVVQAGTDRSWNQHPGDGGDYLDRCSMQRQWLDSRRYQLILERAFLNHTEQTVTFLGVAELTGPDSTLLHAGTSQPLFHVEHSVGGTEQQPENRWRIIHLTKAVDEQLTAVFEHMAADPWLPEHTEIYIRHNLGIELTRN